jgi:AcrR family transcriptional regulator
MPSPRSPSVRDLEQDAKKFAQPTTEKERDIMEAALALIGERGVEHATTAEIARRAGVTERTLFRYFPSKKDLVRRVLVPLLLRGIVAQQLEFLEKLIASDDLDLKNWYVRTATARFEQVAKDPTRARTVMSELLQNDELREAMGTLWRKHIWRPMLQQLERLKARGEIADDVDIEVVARVIHYFQAGYFLTRFVFAPQRKWDDAYEIDQLAELLARACRPMEAPHPSS